MKLSELITKVGDENIEVQFLHECTKKVNQNKDGVTTITFGTKAISAIDLMTEEKMLGLVLWIPRNKLPNKLQ